MAAAGDVYRTFIGFVKFKPREGEAAGQDVRNIVIRSVGVKDQAIDVRVTLWPSHEDVEVEEGDAVLVEGKFSVNTASKDGETTTYFNLSASSILNLGQGNKGVRSETANTGAKKKSTKDEAADDDIPY